MQLFKPYDTAAKQAVKGKNSASDKGDDTRSSKKSGGTASKSGSGTVKATPTTTSTSTTSTKTSSKATTTKNVATSSTSSSTGTTPTKGATTTKGDTTTSTTTTSAKADTTSTTTTSKTSTKADTTTSKSAHPDAPKAPTKKMIPTPTRREAEQARRDRIQPVLTRKESKAREREARFKARDDAMAKANARPYNELIRDWVDRRWNLAEFALPLILVLFVAMIIGTYIWPMLMFIAPYCIWAVFLLLVIDTLVMWVGLRKQLKAHFPNEPLKGKLSYAVSRTMLMRRSRVPLPRLKRGQKFTWPHREEQA